MEGERPREPRTRCAGLIALALATCGALTLTAAGTPDQFAFRRPLTPPAAPHNEVGRFYLDPAVFAVADEAFANLRLFDDTGAETPFLARRSVPIHAVARRVPFPAPLPVTACRELPGNRVELTVAREARAPQAAEIRLESTVRNFEKLVSVSGSTDGQTWTPLAKDEPIYDYTRYVDLRKDAIPVAPGPYTLYRIELGNIVERKDSPLVQLVRQTRGGDNETETTTFLREPFRVERVLFLEQREETVGEQWTMETAEFEAAAPSVVTDSRKRQTVVTVDAGGRPVTRLTARTGDENFSRVARVEACRVDAPDTWQELGSGRLTRIRAGRIRQDALTLDFPETRCRRLRLTIENEDNPPIAVDGVRLGEVRYEALFFPKAGRRYTLAAGGRGFEAPRYDVATVLQPVPSGSADLWTLAAAGPVPATLAPSRAWLTGRTVLVTVLIAMATILAVIIARLARRVDTTNT